MNEIQGAVLAANQAFYDAFRERNLEAMDSLWARRTHVAIVHPGWTAIEGREAVMASWTGILTSPTAPEIHCCDAMAFVHGDSAFVVCTEDLGDDTLVATNVFVLEDGGWHIVHHHAGPGRGPVAIEKPPGEFLH
jgi:ketosteroid isomerase-like protein